MHADIDKLNIEISDNSDKAAKNIDKLSQSLEKLKKAAKDTGLTRLTNQLKKLTEMSQQLSGLNAYTEKVRQFSESIHKLSDLKIPSVQQMNNRIKQLVEMSREMSAFSGAEQFTENVNQICEAMKPMENMGKNNLSSFVKSLKQIPEITKSIDTSTLEEFKNFIKELTSAIQPLTTEVSRSERGLVSLNKIIQSTVSANGNLASSNAVTVKSYTSLASILTSVKVKLVAYGYGLLRVVKAMKGWVDLSNSYIENINLFSVAMGKEADSAFNYAQTVNEALGIDVGEWIRNQGTFKQVTSGFGVIENKANLMSKNLTQLGYDISSFFNITVDEAMQKLQSGISGEIMPMRSIGYALDQATLQQIAYANGINLSISKMTQAQKSQLRYIAILQQSKNVMGDMARTVTTPANAMRILEQQITQLKRSIGNIISLVVQKLLPYIQAFVKLLGDAADYLAKKWGFEIPEIDYSNVGTQLSGLSDEADNVTTSVKKTAKEMQRLAGFDEINTLASNDNSDSSDYNSTNSGVDLGLELPSYDFLTDVDSQVEEIYKNMKNKIKNLINKFKELMEWIKKNKKWVGLLAGVLAGLWAAKEIKDFFKKLAGFSIFKTAKKWLNNFMDGFKNSSATNFFGKLKDGILNAQSSMSLLGKISVGVIGGIIGGFAGFDFMKHLLDGTLTWKRALVDVGIITAAIAGAFIIGGPIAGGIAILGTLIGMAAAIKADYTTLNCIFDNGGVKVSTLTDNFKEQYDKIIETSKKVDEYSEKIKETKEKIKPTYDEMKNFHDSLSNTNKKLSESDVAELKGKLKTISQGIKDNLGYASQSIIDTFKKKVYTAGESAGVDLDKIVTAVQNFEKELSGITDSAEQTIAEYWDKQASGAEITYKDREEFEKAMEFFRLEAERTSEEINAEKKAMQEAMDWSKIDFESPEKFQEALDNFTKQYESAQEAVKNIYETNKANLDDMLSTGKNALKAGRISQSKYNELKRNYDYILGELKKDRDKGLADLKTDAEAFSGAMVNQYSTYVDDLAKEWAENRIHELGFFDVEEFKKTNAQDYAELLAEGKQRALNMVPELSESITQMTKDLKISPNVALGKEWQKYLSKNEEFIRPSAVQGVQDIVNNVDKTARYSLGKIDLTDEAKNMWEPIITEGNNVVTGIEEAFDKLDNHFKELSAKFANAEAQAQETFNKTSVSLGEIYARSPELYIQYGSVNGQSHVRGYATGGYPKKADLFYANENGNPEMVGRIGSRTAVANNQQITEAISKAVYNAVRLANSGRSQDVNVTIPVYYDSQLVEEQQYKYDQRQQVRSNGKR